jgi:Domain of unknown function (DUF397)
MDMKNWRKSSYSSGNGGNCVETASDGRMIAVRDTKNDGNGPVLSFSLDAWAAFTDALKKLRYAKKGRASPMRVGSVRPFRYRADGHGGHCAEPAG